MTAEKGACIFIRGLPRTLHDLFKGYCAQRGKTMKSVITKFMRDCVYQGSDIPPRLDSRTNRTKKTQANSDTLNIQREHDRTDHTRRPGSTRPRKE